MEKAAEVRENGIDVKDKPSVSVRTSRKKTLEQSEGCRELWGSRVYI